jgi:hypothetical protein
MNFQRRVNHAHYVGKAYNNARMAVYLPTDLDLPRYLWFFSLKVISDGINSVGRSYTLGERGGLSVINLV